MLEVHITHVIDKVIAFAAEKDFIPQMQCSFIAYFSTFSIDLFL